MNPNVAAPTPAANGRSQFAIGAWIFLRLLALIHLVAFASYWMQFEGLVGPHGILPASAYFQAAHEQLGAAAYAQLPSLCWILGSANFLHVLCAAGVVFSLLLFAGIAPAASLVLLWASYLSLLSAGQVFFGFQWDALLLETTLLAVFLAPWSWRPRWSRPEPPRLARWLLCWLLFRLMFLSGAVKLTSGDPVWQNLTALAYHYETQPLPTALAWHVHQWPLWFQRFSCALMFTIELAVPALLFASRPFRHGAALSIAAFMTLIFLTGNYTFFNLLTMALCVLCLDDAWWARCTRLTLTRPVMVRAAPQRLLVALAVVVVGYTAAEGMGRLTKGKAVPALFWPVERVIGPFRSLNSYGLFAVMTTARPELIIEGSDDGREWLDYELPHKPGRLDRAPDFIAPFQPRLDWQLWFAALAPADQNPGTPEVLARFGSNPFPNHPPKFVRVVRYDYRFTARAERARSGNWWRRTPLDYYIEPVSLR